MFSLLNCNHHLTGKHTIHDFVSTEYNDMIQQKLNIVSYKKEKEITIVNLSSNRQIHDVSRI